MINLPVNRWQILVFIILHCLYPVAAQQSATYVMKGSHVILPYYSMSDEVEWTYSSSEDAHLKHVYSGGVVYDEYKAQGRFAMNKKVKYDFSLSINDVALEDSGIYSCVEHSATSATYAYRLVVFVNATVGDVVTLPCRPRVKADVDWWYYKSLDDPSQAYIYSGGTLYNGYASRFKLNATEAKDYHELHIQSVRLNDSGIYVCVEDGGTHDQHYMQLVVSAVSDVLSHSSEKHHLFTTPNTVNESSSASPVCCSENEKSIHILALFVTMFILETCLLAVVIYCRRRGQTLIICLQRHVSISRLKEYLKDMIDFNDLMDELAKYKVLTREHCWTLGQNTALSQSEKVTYILEVVEKCSTTKVELFLTALGNSHQQHVVNYIRANADVYFQCDEQILPLDKDTLGLLKRNLLNGGKYDLYIPSLVKLLEERKVITRRQKNYITDKEQLLEVLGRKSVADYNKFVECVRESHPELAKLWGVKAADVYIKCDEKVNDEILGVLESNLLYGDVEYDLHIPSLVIQLEERNVITRSQKEYITDKEQLVEVLKHKSVAEYNKFVECVRERHPELAKLLEVKESSNSASHSTPLLEDYKGHTAANSTLDIV